MVPQGIITAEMHKLVHLIYGMLKTRQPFDANWAKKATAVIETAVSV
jgi:cytochrome c556